MDKKYLPKTLMIGVQLSLLNSYEPHLNFYEPHLNYTSPPRYIYIYIYIYIALILGPDLAWRLRRGEKGRGPDSPTVGSAADHRPGAPAWAYAPMNT
jgi:hypothetical protein